MSDLHVIGGPHIRTAIFTDYEGKPCAIVGDGGVDDHEYRGHYVFWMNGAWRIAPRTREWRGGGYYCLGNAHTAISLTHAHQRSGRKRRDCTALERDAHAITRA